MSARADSPRIAWLRAFGNHLRALREDCKDQTEESCRAHSALTGLSPGRRTVPSSEHSLSGLQLANCIARIIDAAWRTSTYVPETERRSVLRLGLPDHTFKIGVGSRPEYEKTILKASSAADCALSAKIEGTLLLTSSSPEIV